MAIRLPLLRPELDLVDRIEIPTPCTVPWDSMHGDERIRHCGSCRKSVYNVAALTRAQAMDLIYSREPVCLRIYRRPDGTVVTNDCWSRLRAARRQGLWAFLAMLVIVGWAELAAMVVGLAGLRRVISRPTTAAAAAAPIATRPPAPSPKPYPYPHAWATAGVPRLPYVDPPKHHRGHGKHGKSSEKPVLIDDL